MWGGQGVDDVGSSGGRYAPAIDTWTPTSVGADVPSPRTYHHAIWTGKEMIVWGGRSGFTEGRNTGARYDPNADSWLPTSTGANVPAARTDGTVVWTGTEMVVWGGRANANSSGGSPSFNTGGRYNPATDTWLPTSTGTGVPSPRFAHAAVWTGSEMIVWGGNAPGSVPLDSGARYDPLTETWVTTPLGPAPRGFPSFVWTGTEMIVWGGNHTSAALNTGGRYHPVANSWAATSTGAGVPSLSPGAPAWWTGSEMIVWSGGTGGRYDPSADSWTPTSTANAPGGQTTVWTGTELIAWSSGPISGRYCACPDGRFVYRDADGDGYGNAAISSPTCDGSIPSGYAADGTDCNDTNASVHPGVTEVCNGVDDDCDIVADNDGASLCDDANACTEDTCNGASGCASTSSTGPNVDSVSASKSDVTIELGLDGDFRGDHLRRAARSGGASGRWGRVPGTETCIVDNLADTSIDGCIRARS